MNRAKSNDWVSSDKNIPVVDGEGYIDPCKSDFNDHFERDSQGNILARNSSPVAKYMCTKLKLYLKRYAIIWTLDQIYTVMKLLKDKIEMTVDGDGKKELISALGELSMEFLDYLKYLEAERR
ncbi:MAG: hypothetical protein K8R58_11750 [Bacteroidales bacterium]|nr:hypothetical protein [Bacteroidales bacterium]